jgi:hypothetical protein
MDIKESTNMIRNHPLFLYFELVGDPFNVTLTSSEQHAIYIYKKNIMLYIKSNPMTNQDKKSKLTKISRRTSHDCYCDIKLQEFIFSSDRQIGSSSDKKRKEILQSSLVVDRPLIIEVEEPKKQTKKKKSNSKESEHFTAVEEAENKSDEENKSVLITLVEAEEDNKKNNIIPAITDLIIEEEKKGSIKESVSDMISRISHEIFDGFDDVGYVDSNGNRWTFF